MNPDNLPNPMPTPDELAALLGGPQDAEARRVAEAIAEWREEQAAAQRRVAEYRLNLAKQGYESNMLVANAHEAKAASYRMILEAKP